MAEPTIPTAAVDVAVAWWSERWEKPESRDAFAAALRSMLSGWTGSELLLEVDYDPNEMLLHVVRQVEPGCRGFMFSAKDLLPSKTRMFVGPTEVRAADGRREPWLKLWEMASKRAKSPSPPERVYVTLNERGRPVDTNMVKENVWTSPDETVHKYRLVTPPKKRAGGRRK